jgi:hypothetical protein
MIPRLKIAGIAAATLALSGIVVGSASANWFVNGTELKGSAAIATAAAVDANTVLRINAGETNIKILCTGSTLETINSKIFGTKTAGAEKLIFKACETTEPATKCALTAQPTSITTEPLGVKIAGNRKAPEDRVALTPVSKQVFLNIPFNASDTACGIFDELIPINGSLVMSMPRGETEAVAQLIEALGTTENNSLEVAGDKTYIEGTKVLLQLASGAKWSFLPSKEERECYKGL